MCGRYTLMRDEEYGDIRKIIEQAQKKVQGTPVKTGEIFPTDLAPVLMRERGGVEARPAIWGFPGFKGKGVIINARAETAGQKPMFSEALNHGRCVIPTTGFYEWDRDKNKYLFMSPASVELYLAGIWRSFGVEGRYAVLTTAANSWVNKVHHRMPVLVEKCNIEEYLAGNTSAGGLLAGSRMELVCIPKS